MHCPWIVIHVLELQAVGSAFCKLASLDQPGSCKLLGSCGRAQDYVELSLRYFGILDSVIYQVNGQASPLM